ncbi:TIGR02391 family protein [Micrococcus luteus]|nr:TIGR02391 family protein [Micrococcus luteus]
MTQHSSAYLRNQLDALQDFREAFNHFMDLHDEGDITGPGLGYLPTCWPRDDADRQDVEQRTEAVAMEAGRCARVAGLTGTRVIVQGIGVVDPFVNWDNMLRPKAWMHPSELRRLIATAAGTLGALVAEAGEAERGTPELPTLGPTSLHPVVWTAASPFWTMHQLTAAVRAAAEAVVQNVKDLGVKNDIQDTPMWLQLFSDAAPVAGRPRLRWPGEPDDQDVKTMQGGLRHLATGVQMTIRNPSTHTKLTLTEQEAFERLATLSLLCRFVEMCNVERVDDNT